MAFIPVTNTIQVNVNQRLDGQQVQNTLYVRTSAAVTSTDLTEVANIVGDTFINSLYPFLSFNLTMIEVVAFDLSQQNGNQVSVPYVPAEAGGAVSPSLPNNVALCVSLRTASRGRSARGRNFVAGIPENAVDNSRVLQSFAENVQTAYVGLVGSLTAEGYTAVVVSRFANSLPRAAGVTFPITAVLITDLVVDTQRRRLPGRGV